jgi:hypothetical protein
MPFDATAFFRFSVAALATWRLAFLLARERGPRDVLVHFRRAIGHGVFGDLFTCVKCLGLWVAIPFAFFVRGDWIELVVIWLALAGVTALIDEWTRPPFEWRDANGDDVVGDRKGRDVEGVK